MIFYTCIDHILKRTDDGEALLGTLNAWHYLVSDWLSMKVRLADVRPVPTYHRRLYVG
jgi:hypothetical protein